MIHTFQRKPLRQLPHHHPPLWSQRETSQKLCLHGFVAQLLKTKATKPIGHKEKKIRHLLSINKNAKYFPKEEQKKLMKGDGDGPKVKSSSLFGYKYSISSILPVWEI